MQRKRREIIVREVSTLEEAFAGREEDQGKDSRLDRVTIIFLLQSSVSCNK
jgi:hypothetical protein